MRVRVAVYWHALPGGRTTWHGPWQSAGFDRHPPTFPKATTVTVLWTKHCWAGIQPPAIHVLIGVVYDLGIVCTFFPAGRMWPRSQTGRGSLLIVMCAKREMVRSEECSGLLFLLWYLEPRPVWSRHVLCVNSAPGVSSGIYIYWLAVKLSTSAWPAGNRLASGQPVTIPEQFPFNSLTDYGGGGAGRGKMGGVVYDHAETC